ncbi:iron complex outermembrane recepter protein [Pseudarcicella hirudinis]|uniref:Iron complex outermembrane recepter protein n=1 Tax=Pseudarcicella hirudinis TaxID=1079859 RepID=A0A1I5YXJ8_9BACT|nr:TonB-dependent receptor [Pseudarcicella hirudinis]SFQ48976.1 iron complex outermembrane recepter protein [Pseudarcicella hirudinis]
MKNPIPNLRSHLIYSIFLVLSTFIANAQGVIKGRVTTSDGKSAEFVTLSLKGTSRGATSNEKGEYRIEKVKPGKYIIQASFIGLETKNHSVTVESGKESEQDFVLQENSQQLQEVVISANPNNYNPSNSSPSLRILTPILETPQNIQVITGKLLADQQIFDMLEGVTRNVSGATRVEHWDNYARINMRGSQIAAFRNGMNVQMPWGPLAEDMSMVERIEFVKGPAGFMMANGEPSGFYNVVTKKPTGITKGEASLSLGSFDTYRSTLDLDGKLSKDGKLLYRLNIMGQAKGSHRDYEYNNRYSVVPVIKYKFNEQTSLTAEYTYQFSQMSTVGSNYAFSAKGYADLPYNFTTGDPNIDPTNINDHSLLLILNHQINDNWKLTGQLAYFNFSQIGSSLWPSGIDKAGNLQRSLSIWDAASENKMGQIFVNGDVQTGSVSHRILAGLDMSTKHYMADWGQNFKLNGSVPFNIYHPVYGLPLDSVPVFDRSRSLRARAGGNVLTQSYTGLYVQDEMHLLDDKVRLTLAGRYTTAKDSQYGASTNESVFTPRVGISVSLDKNSSVYGVYDQAFVPQSGVDFFGKKFDPIKGNNLEAGLKRDWMGGRWNTTLSVYQITKNNVLTSDPAHINFSIQLGQTTTKGVEFDLRGEIVKGLNLTLNYAYTDARVTKDSQSDKVDVAVPGSTKHVTNGWLSYQFKDQTLKGFGLSLGYQWQIDRSSWYVFDGTNQSLPDYFRMDGGLSWRNEKFTVALNVNNLLDKYLFSGAPYGSLYYWQTEAPRNTRVTIGYKF